LRHPTSATIGADCSIGPFLALPPSSTLADTVHIGNFVRSEEFEDGGGLEAIISHTLAMRTLAPA